MTVFWTAPFPRKSDYYLKIVSDEVQRLSRLVRSMLDMARIEAGEITLNKKDVDINEIVVTTVLYLRAGNRRQTSGCAGIGCREGDGGGRSGPDSSSRLQTWWITQ